MKRGEARYNRALRESVRERVSMYEYMLIGEGDYYYYYYVNSSSRYFSLYQSSSSRDLFFFRFVLRTNVFKCRITSRTLYRELEREIAGWCHESAKRGIEGVRRGKAHFVKSLLEIAKSRYVSIWFWRFAGARFFANVHPRFLRFTLAFFFSFFLRGRTASRSAREDLTNGVAVNMIYK